MAGRRGDERSGQLQGITGAERVHAKKTCRRFANRVGRFDLVPARGELPKPIERRMSGAFAERAFALESRQR